jgi:chromosome segregation ATPase
MRGSELSAYHNDLAKEWGSDETQPERDFEDWMIVKIWQLRQQCQFWEDAHARLEERLRIEYGAELEAFKVSFSTRTQNEFEEKINEAAHISASEITSLHKELDKRDESIKNLIRINNNITDEVNNQFNHLAEKHDEIINLTNQLEKSNQQIQRMTMQMMQLQIRLKNQDDPNDGKNSSHIHSGGKGGWSV